MLSTAKRPRVVIVGAGFGGVRAARGLAVKGVDILLIDRLNHHVFQPLASSLRMFSCLRVRATWIMSHNAGRTRSRSSFEPR